MDDVVNERWLSRQELADRHGLPAKTLAQGASNGTGPRYARVGQHVRYCFSDVIDWEAERVDDLGDTAEGGVTTRHVLERMADSTTVDANVGKVRNK
jgi:hypothetical protein